MWIRCFADNARKLLTVGMNGEVRSAVLLIGQRGQSSLDELPVYEAPVQSRVSVWVNVSHCFARHLAVLVDLAHHTAAVLHATNIVSY